MAQLAFAMNYFVSPRDVVSRSVGNVYFAAFNFEGSVYFRTVNMVLAASNTTGSYTISAGLYSMNVSTLSIANSISGTLALPSGGVGYIGLTATSTTQNITPGTWYFGYIIATSSQSRVRLLAASSLNPGNAFPGSFIGGRLSSAALPATVATSDLDVTGNDAMTTPMIIVSA